MWDKYCAQLAENNIFVWWCYAVIHKIPSRAAFQTNTQSDSWKLFWWELMKRTKVKNFSISQIPWLCESSKKLLSKPKCTYKHIRAIEIKFPQPPVSEYLLLNMKTHSHRAYQRNFYHFFRFSKKIGPKWKTRVLVKSFEMRDLKKKFDPEIFFLLFKLGVGRKYIKKFNFCLNRAWHYLCHRRSKPQKEWKNHFPRLSFLVDATSCDSNEEKAQMNEALFNKRHLRSISNTPLVAHYRWDK